MLDVNVEGARRRHSPESTLLNQTPLWGSVGSLLVSVHLIDDECLGHADLEQRNRQGRELQASQRRVYEFSPVSPHVKRTVVQRKGLQLLLAEVRRIILERVRSFERRSDDNARFIFVVRIRRRRRLAQSKLQSTRGGKPASVPSSPESTLGRLKWVDAFRCTSFSKSVARLACAENLENRTRVRRVRVTTSFATSIGV